MFIIAVCSSEGGAGKTTVAANLATLMAKSGRATVAVEWDPANVLGFHLGLADRPATGWIPTPPFGAPRYETSHRNSDDVEFLCFGESAEGDRLDFEHLLRRDEDWLARNLRDIELPVNSVTFIDTVRAPSVYFNQAVRAADLVLVVTTPHPAFAAQIDRIESLLAHLRFAQLRSAPVLFLLNQVDTTRRLGRDVLTIMRSKLQQRLLRYTIHRDESVREATACNCSLAAYAPDSQAAHDIQGIAVWLIKYLSERSSANLP